MYVCMHVWILFKYTPTCYRAALNIRRFDPLVISLLFHYRFYFIKVHFHCSGPKNIVPDNSLSGRMGLTRVGHVLTSVNDVPCRVVVYSSIPQMDLSIWRYYFLIIWYGIRINSFSTNEIRTTFLPIKTKKLWFLHSCISPAPFSHGMKILIDYLSVLILIFKLGF